MCRLKAKRLLSRNQFSLQVENTSTRAQSSLQFQTVKGLDEIVIGTGFKTHEDVFSLAPGCQHDKIDVRDLFPPTYFLANLRSVHPWHHPIKDGQLRVLRAVKLRQSLGPL